MKKNNLLKKNLKGESPKSENWDKEIKELEDFFKTAILPAQPFQLNSFSRLIDVPLFIKSHLTIVKANNGNQIYFSFLERLQELKNLLIKRQTDAKTITNFFELTDK